MQRRTIMAQKILGLDIGSHSVKAALFETSFRAYELTDLFQSAPLKLEDVDLEDQEVVVAEAILQMIQKNNLAISNTVTALSGKFVSNRMMKLPLPPRQLSKVLPFEIESYIPFPLEELVIDHHVIQSSKTETVCVAAATQKSVIQQHLSILQKSQIEPSFVTFDTISLYNLNQLVSSNYKTYAIIDLGYQKSSICIISNQKIGLIRTLYTGGKDIDDALRTELNLTVEQAAEVKEKHGILELPHQELRSGDLKKLSNCLKGVVQPMFQEIMQSFNMFKAQEWIDHDAQKIEHVLFCGGTSLLRNLPEYFTAQTNIPSQRMYMLEEQGDERPSKLKEPLFATAVGIGMKIAARGNNAALIDSINFRKDEFSYAKSLGDLKDKMMFFGKWVAVIFFLAFLQMIVRNNQLRHENNAIEKIALQEYKKIVPDSKVRDSKAAVKKLETKMQELQQKQDVLTAGLNKTTALGILRELSVLIPPDIIVDTKELSIERNKISLKGTTDSFASVDKIIANLQGNPLFQRVEKGDISEAEGKKSFQITILVGDPNAPVANPKDAKESK